MVAAVVGTIGVVGSIVNGNKQASAASRAADSASAASAEQLQLEREKFDFQKQQYQNDILPMQRQQMELQTRIATDSLGRAAKQDKLADEQKAYYDTTFKPIEQKVASEAMGYDSMANIDKRSGMAAANVTQQMSNAAGQRARLAGRYGLGSSTFANQAGTDARVQALGTAGAATGAAFDTMDKGIQLRAGAASFGRNMPNTALAGFAGANGSSGTAGNAANSAMTGAMQGANFMSNAYSGLSSGIGNAAQLGMQAASAQSNMYGNIASGFGQLAGAGINAAGGWGGIGSKIGGLFSGGGNDTGFGSGVDFGNQDLGLNF